ncbi:hypothetical protein [Eubacterium sp.]
MIAGTNNGCAYTIKISKQLHNDWNWFYKFRKLNPKKLDHRRSLINNFVNSVFLYEDRMVITFNFKDSTETITFADLEKSALGSALKVPSLAKNSNHHLVSIFFVMRCILCDFLFE